MIFNVPVSARIDFTASSRTGTYTTSFTSDPYQYTENDSRPGLSEDSRHLAFTGEIAGQSFDFDVEAAMFPGSGASFYAGHLQAGSVNAVDNFTSTETGYTQSGFMDMWYLDGSVGAWYVGYAPTPVQGAIQTISGRWDSYATTPSGSGHSSSENSISYFSYVWKEYSVSINLDFFTNLGDVVNFNNLTELQNIYLQYSNADDVHASLGGDDVVELPNSQSIGGYKWDSRETFYAGGGNDLVTGGALDDTINGGLNQDTLKGGAGKDTIYGGDGADIISGGDNDDSLYGNAGSDIFYGVSVSTTTQSGEFGINTIDGGFYGDAADVDTVLYNGSYAEYTIHTSLSRESGEGFVMTVEHSGSSDEIHNWELLKFKDVALKESELYKRGSLTYALWAVDIAFGTISKWVHKLDAFKNSDGEQRFAPILKWFDVTEKVTAALAQAAISQSVKTQIQTLAVHAVHEAIDPIIDLAAKQMKLQISNLPTKVKDPLNREIDAGAQLAKEQVDKAVVDGIAVSWNKLGIPDQAEWSDIWKTVIDQVSKTYQKLPDREIFQFHEKDTIKPHIDNPQDPVVIPITRASYTGGERDEVLVGNGTDQTFYAKGGDDVVFGGGGKDMVIASSGKGNDAYDGGIGIDTITFASTKNGVVVNIQSGFASGSETDQDTLKNFEVIIGGSGRDSISGSTRAETLFGGSGVDTVDGAAGGDVINGGFGGDKLFGGAGADTFAFTSIKDSFGAGVSRDSIFDFSATQRDRIDLSAIDANSKVSGNQAFSYIGAAAFYGKAGELRYEKQASDTIVYGDINGDKKADFAIHFDDALSLQKGFFLL